MSSSLFYFESDDTYGHCHYEYESHFLDACSRCRRPLAVDRDIFMYKGIKAFCSDECRQQQIQIDNRPPWKEPKKSGWDFSASLRALRKVIPAAAKSWRPSSAVTSA